MIHDPNCGNFCCYGARDRLVLRERYAGLAMQGLLAAGVTAAPDDPNWWFTVARSARRCADALVAELAKKEDSK